MDRLEEARRLFLDALALHQKGELEQARALYERALVLAPGRASVMNNLATVYVEQGKFVEARGLCESILEKDPADEVALVNLGKCQVVLNEPGAALLSYEKALAVMPDYAEALYGRGNILRRRGQLEAALSSYDRVLASVPGHLGALNNRCIVLEELDRREELINAYQQLLGVAPEHPYMRGYLLHAQLRCCQWPDYDTRIAQVIGDVRAGKRADSPFHFLVISDSAADQLQCARTCIADEYPAAAQPVWRGERYGHDRIRVAYVSADFHGHAVSFLHAGLMEAHDRSRFDITAVSLGPEREDETRARLKAAFDRFIDVRDRSDLEVARLLRELEIDIAVDLQGFTSGCRTGIFAHRGAPLHVNWLGYPGTLGAGYIDYIIGDGTVIPQEHHTHYAEKIVTLPDCYQPNDTRRRIAERTPTRAELGLPARGFVFCCFNNNHKITPSVFDAWMRLLKGTEGSVLWLLRDHEIAERMLRSEAERRGVAPARLIFAPRVKPDEHLARQRQADLFLDTLPYNAHVTASDALWAGLPLLTCIGGAFAGRVAASLLHAIGLPELITRSGKEYEALALKLATDRAMLADIRAKLARNQATHPLFDTDRFRRHIEAAYVTMWERYQRGEPPASFAVEAIRQSASGTVQSRFRPLQDSAHRQDSAAVEAKFQQALAHHQRGELDQADRLCREIVAQMRDSFDALLMLGLIEGQRGNTAAAVELIRQANRANPDSATAHSVIGDALLALQQSGEALVSYERALALEPDLAAAHIGRGSALLQMEQPQEALASYERVLAVLPGHPEALYNRGIALENLSRLEEALASYDQALATKPDYPEALTNRGVTLVKLGRLEDALASYDRALAVKPDQVEALNNRSSVLAELARHDEAVESYSRLLELAPGQDYVLGHMFYSRLHCCDWSVYEETADRIVQGCLAGSKVLFPFISYVLKDSAELQYRCAQAFVSHKRPAASQPVWRGERYPHDRIRLAYVSYDFRDHVVAHQLAGLIERHDRARFETTGISLHPESTGTMQDRLRSAFERFVDASDRGDLEAARLVRELEIDILVDLTGHTRGDRLGIFARRPAPIQVNFLCPGTSGTAYLDYVIADGIVIPSEHQPYYTEKIVHLPETFQPHELTRSITARRPSRGEVGLPERGFVFCSFNASYKFSPRMFDVWMHLLLKIEGSILWLASPNSTVTGNLRREARARGVDPERLVFAPRVDGWEDHLARQRLADLFLDTLPYNAQITAKDALSVGLPVLTCLGGAFAGRVAASLLNAVGLPELVTRSLPEYEALALKLASDRSMLAEIRAKLARNQATHPLFDTDRFRRHLEAAYITMWERHQRGEPPASFAVPRLLRHGGAAGVR